MPVALILFSSSAPSASIEIKPTVVLERIAVPKAPYEMGMGIAEFPPNASKPWHRATGPEVCYVLEGSVTVQTQNDPPHTYRAGESFQLAENLLHLTTAGAKGAKVLAAWTHVPGDQFNLPGPPADPLR